MDKLYIDILKGSSVLLVDDNEELRKKIKRLLALYCKKIYEAENGRIAHEIYIKKSPSLIITDVDMPITNGLDFVKKIRKHNTKIPIIIISAYTQQEYLLEAIPLLLVDYLIKPIKHNDLLIRLEKAAKQLAKNILRGDIKLSDEHIYDAKKKTILYNNVEIELTNTEILFIELLVLHKGNIVTKQMFEKEIYVYKEMSESALKNIVFKLRKRIGKKLIKTEPNGYKIF